MEEKACLIDWVHQAWEGIDKTEVLRDWNESGLSAAWDEEMKNYAKIVASLFEKHSEPIVHERTGCASRTFVLVCERELQLLGERVQRRRFMF